MTTVKIWRESKKLLRQSEDEAEEDSQIEFKDSK